MEGFGIVKAVLSGDSLVVLGAPKAGSDAPPPELTLSLSGLAAPRLCRHPEGAPDEPYAWEAREFLRNALIGRQIKFKCEPASSGGSSRHNATCWTSPSDATVNELVVAAGWARPTPGAGERLVQVAAEAQRGGLGLYATGGATPASGVRDITWSVSDPSSLVSSSPLTGVVETVINGSTFRIYVPSVQVMMTLALAGVVCPRAELPVAAVPVATPTPPPAAPVPVRVPVPSASGKGAWGKPPPVASTSTATAAATPTPSPPAHATSTVSAAPPPSLEVQVGNKAKIVSSIRVLHRTVQVVVKGVEKSGVAIGVFQVTQPGSTSTADDLPLFLLRNGYGRIADFTLPHLPVASVGGFRSAQRAAQAERLGLWLDFNPAAAAAASTSSGAGGEYTGRVVEVVSGDTLVVATGAGLEHRVTLASVRAQRGGNLKEGAAPQPWAGEAKEALRRLAVGRDVAVRTEFESKRPEGGGEVRVHATVKLLPVKKGGVEVDLGAAMVSDGLAEVVKATPHAAGWDDLLRAEVESKSAKKGMWSGAAPNARVMADLTRDAAKAKAHWALLTVDKALRGVVDYIPAGGRASIALPGHSVIIACAAMGVKCPYPPKTGNATRSGREGDPLGAEALAHTRALIMQREVDIIAHSLDPHGTCVASIYIGSGAARMSVGVDLVRRGLGYALPHICERFPEGAEVLAAEAEARAAKRGVWALESAAAEAAAAVDAPVSDASIAVTVADVRNGSHVFVHKEEEAGVVASVNARMDEVKAEVGTQCAYVDAAKGRVLLALFTDDAGVNTWVRARVEGKAKDAAGAVIRAPDGADMYDVVHIDYGTSDRVTVSSLRPCEGVWATLPPLAHPATLAYVRVPPLGKDGGEDAARFLSDTVMGQRITMRVHGRDTSSGGAALVSLWSEDGSACANEMLVEAGLARVARTEAKRLTRRAGTDAAAYEQDMALLRRLEEAQVKALRDRVGMFRYGDVGDSDDDTLRGPPRGGAARK